MDQLKRALVRVWDKIPQSVVRAAVRDFDRRLAATVAARGGHFE